MKEKHIKYIKIVGIHCQHCVSLLEGLLCSLEGVESTQIRGDIAQISGASLPSDEKIIKTVCDADYFTKKEYISESRIRVDNHIKWYEFLIILAVILGLAFGVKAVFGVNIFTLIPNIDSSITLGALFVTGLLTSIHCIGMCGAINLAASNETNSVKDFKRPVLYNLGRVVSYTAIGAAAGALGSVFELSPTVSGIIILIAAAVMLLMALGMLGIVGFTLPSFCTLKFKKKRTGAFVVGLLNGFMPCGPLQAMQLYALSTGSALMGALSMLLFSLGTVPLMLGAGLLTNLLTGKKKIIINKIAAVLILVLAVVMLNRGLTSFGINPARILSLNSQYVSAQMQGDYQYVETELDYDSFGDIAVKKGVPVRFNIKADASKITGCNNEVICPELGIDTKLKAGDNIIEFTADETGEITYTCWMNMIKNTIVVEE